MKNMLRYLKKYAGRTMASLPFNELDAGLLSQIVYLPLEELFSQRGQLTMAEAAEALKDMPADKPYEFMLRPRLETLRLSGASRRFGNAPLRFFQCDTDKDFEKQFCAVTAFFDGFAVIIFRGTDLTLAGWKEDFNMAYQCPIPAQEDAVHYLDTVALQTKVPLLVCGHSKGGNLAVYASLHAREDAVRRIHAVYSLDGPGLWGDDADKLHQREDVPPIISLLPQKTLVGILFQQPEPYRVVRSRSLSLLQHDPYRWRVEGTRFKTAKRLSLASRLMDDSLEKWLTALSEEDRALFVETLYAIVAAPKRDTLGGIVRGGRRSAQQMLAALQDVPEDVMDKLQQMAGQLFTTAFSTIKGRLTPGKEK